MAGFAGSSDDDVISSINVTPLVDVALVLLIIFLITAPVLYQSAIKVQLPKAATGEESTKTPLSFTLTKDAKLSWGNDAVDWDALGPKLVEYGKGKDLSAETAIINADENTPEGQVIRLMDALRTVGMTRFAMTVEGRTPPKAAQ